MTIEALPGGDAFWSQLPSGQLGTFHNEYLVTCHTFDADWPMSEMHPNGDEVVCLLAGAVTFILELGEGSKEIELTSPGSFVVVPKGTWHTARVRATSLMLFITAGEGTQHRGPIR